MMSVLSDEFDWGERTLVASYCYPPYNDASGVVAAKRVREFGRPVDVLSNAMDRIRSRDNTLTQISGQLVERFAALPSPSAFSSWRSIATFVDLGMEAALRWESGKGAYHQIYSRAQFAASHFLAARYKAARPEVKWIAEFSDPLSHDVMGVPRVAPVSLDHLAVWLQRAVAATGFRLPDRLNVYEWCEVLAFALADELIFTNDLQREFMLSRCHDTELAERVRGRSVVAPHPTLPRNFYGLVESRYRVPSDYVNIGYFGNLYANRGVGLIFDALSGLAPQIRAKLRLHVFTSQPAVLASAIHSFGLQDVVSANSFVPYLEFLALSDRFDFLLVNDAVTPQTGELNPFLPSKWSDYRGSSTPVWAITEEGSTLDGMEDGVAYRSPVGHVSALQQVLMELASNERTSAGRGSGSAAPAI